MDGSIDKVRNWLDKNKIFFEIIVALSLTLMSIIISYNANLISTNQNDILKKENQPIFLFNVSKFTDPGSNIEDSNSLSEDMERSNDLERIDVFNIGKPAYNCKVRECVFFDVALRNITTNESSIVVYYAPIEKNVLIPVQGYYNFVESNGSPTGLMISFHKCPHPIIGASTINNRYMVANQIKNDLSNDSFYSKSKQHTVYAIDCVNHTTLSYSWTNSQYEYDVSIATYFFISYTDIFDETHDELYYVSRYKSQHISDADKLFILNEYEVNTPIEFNSDISPKQIITLFHDLPPEPDDLPHNVIFE